MLEEVTEKPLTLKIDHFMACDWPLKKQLKLLKWCFAAWKNMNNENDFINVFSISRRFTLIPIRIKKKIIALLALILNFDQ